MQIWSVSDRPMNMDKETCNEFTYPPILKTIIHRTQKQQTLVRPAVEIKTNPHINEEQKHDHIINQQMKKVLRKNHV